MIVNPITVDCENIFIKKTYVLGRLINSMKFFSLKFIYENKKLYANIKMGITIDIAKMLNCIFFKIKESIIKNIKTNKYINLNSRNETETYERKIDKENNIIII
mgnify:FL=1|jgi:hypothetical protein